LTDDRQQRSGAQLPVIWHDRPEANEMLFRVVSNRGATVFDKGRAMLR